MRVTSVVCVNTGLDNFGCVKLEYESSAKIGSIIVYDDMKTINRTIPQLIEQLLALSKSTKENKKYFLGYSCGYELEKVYLNSNQIEFCESDHVSRTISTYACVDVLIRALNHPIYN